MSLRGLATYVKSSQVMPLSEKNILHTQMLCNLYYTALPIRQPCTDLTAKIPSFCMTDEENLAYAQTQLQSMFNLL